MPEFWWPVVVRYGETGVNGLARLASVADWFQEAAGLHADALHFGERELHARGIPWVLTRLHLRIARLPGIGEAVKIHTWPAGKDHLGQRCYEVAQDDGTVIIRATGAWALMNLETRHMVDIPDSFAAILPEVTGNYLPFATRVLPKLRETERSAAILVRHDDLDINRHVNNARYLGWLCEPLDAAAPAEVDMQFRAECFPGDVLESACSALSSDGGGLPERVHVLTRTKDGRTTDVCRAVTRWQR